MAMLTNELRVMKFKLHRAGAILNSNFFHVNRNLALGQASGAG